MREEKWGYEVRRRGLHKLWSVARLTADWTGLDDGSEDLVVFFSFSSSFSSIFFFYFPISNFQFPIFYRMRKKKGLTSTQFLSTLLLQYQSLLT